jgi:hypothetical protein
LRRPASRLLWLKIFLYQRRKRKSRVRKTLEDGTGRRWREEEESSVRKLLERGYDAVWRSVAEWSKQQQLCYVASRKKKREKSEEKEKKEKWPVGPRKWAS